GVPVLPAGEALVDVPDPAPIYGGAKLTGNIGRRLTLGLLSAITGRVDVQGQPTMGPAATHLADPGGGFDLLRRTRAIGDNAHLGLIASTTNRFEPDSPAPAPRAFHDAYVGGVDGRWRSPSGTYAVTGQLIGSLIDQGPPRQFLDGTVVASGDASAGGEI